MRLRNSAEGGTNTTTVTQAVGGNSGGTSGDYFDGVTIGAGGALIFDNTHARDTLSYKIAPASGQLDYLEWSTQMGTQTTVYGRFYIWLDTSPVASPIITFRSGATICARLSLSGSGANGTLNWKDSPLVDIPSTTTAAMTPSQWYRVEFKVIFSATVGQVFLNYYLGDSTTAIETLSSTALQNLGASNTDTFRIGRTAGVTNTYIVWLDNIEVNNTGFPGPASLPIAPPTFIQRITTNYSYATPACFFADVGTIANTVSGSTSVLTLAADTDQINHYLIARVAVDNSGAAGAAPGLTITDSKSNTWTVGAAANRTPGSVSNDGTSCYIAYSKMTTRLLASDTITFTWGSGSPAAKAIVVEEWANIHLTTPVTTAQTTTTGASTTPSISRTSSTAAGECAYAALAVEGGTADTFTDDATVDANGVWRATTRTGAGTTTSGQTIAGSVKQPSTVPHTNTWAPTITSRDWAQVALCFQSVDPGANFKTTKSFSVLAGDVLVACCMTQEYRSGNTAVTRGDVRSVTGGSLTWTLQQQFAVGTNGQAVAAIYTAVVDVDKTMSVACGINEDFGGLAYGMDVLTFRGSSGIGASSKDGVASTTAPTLTFSTTHDDSVLVLCVSDWNNTDGTSRAWRTPTDSTAITEQIYYRDPSQVGDMADYVGFHSDAGVTGNKTVGLTAPSMRWSIAAVEVFGMTVGGFSYGANVGLLVSTAPVSFGTGE